MKNYLFVYGTLRKNYDLKLKEKVKGGLAYVGQAKIGAALYDIGRYPGAVKDRTGKEVVGDVFLVSDPAAVFGVLDKYEGFEERRAADSEFVRRKGKVRLRGGKELNAWIYWYNFDPAGKTMIRYKDYLNYLKNKSIH
ncbi:MAG TPA: gamma-glutamylcyclotransferase family protein [Puia sp.]|nr:gamma-glutamylcyclotransferase family protein [Puia sp.]